MLRSIKLENFKSFRDATEISIGDGFNCISGENGAGKSNLLDAVSFALGEGPSNLRVKSLADLLSMPNRKLEVEVLLSINNAVNDDEDDESHHGKSHHRKKVSTLINRRIGSLIVDGVRYYLVDGVRQPKHRFDEQISKLGLHVGGQAVWRITQCEIDRKVSMSPAEMYDALSQVSGTKLFNERRRDALNQLKTCKKSLVEVKRSVQQLDSEVATER